MERYEEAREQFLGAIAMDSTYAGAYAKLGGLCQRAGDRRCARANYASFLRHWRGEKAVAETTFDEGSKRCPSRGNRIGYERGKYTQNSALFNALSLLGFYNVSGICQCARESFSLR